MVPNRREDPRGLLEVDLPAEGIVGERVGHGQSRHMAPVLVRWMDARGATPTWGRADELDEGLCEIVTLGFLAAEYSDHIVIAPHVQDDELDVAGAMYIPRGCVVQMADLTLPERPDPIAEIIRRATPRGTILDVASSTIVFPENGEGRSP